MKGAMAEPFAKTSRAPTSTSVITIGASQYFLFSLMNCQSSLTTCAFDINRSLKSFLTAPGNAPTILASLADFSGQFSDPKIPATSKHFLVVTRITLALGIGPPIGSAARTSPAKRIPARKPFHYSDRCHYQEEYCSQDDPGHHERQSFRQQHPGTIW